jgi:hypothetical protein
VVAFVATDLIEKRINNLFRAFQNLQKFRAVEQQNAGVFRAGAVLLGNRAGDGDLAGAINAFYQQQPEQREADGRANYRPGGGKTIFECRLSGTAS